MKAQVAGFHAPCRFDQQPVLFIAKEEVPSQGVKSRRLVSKDIQLTLALHPPIRLVKADSGQTEQVVMNLAVNARDAAGLILITTTRSLHVSDG